MLAALRGQRRTGKSGGGTSPTPFNQPCGRDDDGLHAQALRSPGLALRALPGALELLPTAQVCLLHLSQETYQGICSSGGSPSPTPAPPNSPQGPPELGKKECRLCRWRQRFILFRRKRVRAPQHRSTWSQDTEAPRTGQAPHKGGARRGRVVNPSTKTTQPPSFLGGATGPQAFSSCRNGEGKGCTDEAASL